MARAEPLEQDSAEHVNLRIRDALRRRAYGEIRRQIDEIEREQRSQGKLLLHAILWGLGVSAVIAYAVYSYYR